MFTRVSNFTYGDLKIANIQTTYINNDIELQIYLQTQEENCLRMILGDCMYDDLMDNVELDPNGYYQLKVDAEEKWDWLLNGLTYEATDPIISGGCGCGCHSGNCSKHKWDGLVRKVATVAQTDVIESLMAPYIYYNWSISERTMVTGVGEAKGKAQNTTQESSMYRRIDAWNDFVKRVDFGWPNTRVSLNQFLKEHQGEFANAQTVCMDTRTYWNI